MVKVSYNKFHDSYEVYRHHKGKQHIAYVKTRFVAEMVARAAQRALDMA